MIGKLKGLLDEVAENHILLDVQGVGYLVFISLATKRALPLPGAALSLFIETQMREDALRLFGFFTRAEQEWFRLLQNVQGVGAKLALAILGSLSPDDLAQAILLQDAATICRAPGVGKKMAERLITELKNKIPAAAKAFAPSEKTSAAEQNIAGADLSHNLTDAISALANLGYKSEEAARAVAQAAKQQEGVKDTAELIRIGLQILAKKMHNNG